MRSEKVVQKIPLKPVFIFDGGCGFCCRWVDQWRAWTGESVEFRPAPDPSFPEIPAEAYAQSSVFVDSDGRIYSGAEAVFRMLAHVRTKAGWLGAYQHLPGFAPISEWVYGRIAGNRSTISRLEKVFVSDQPYVVTVRLFLRLLGLVYLCAFLSLWSQIHGLIGSAGILPVSELMQAAGQQVSGTARWHQLPTFCWLSASDPSLTLQCALGVLFSATLMAGLVPALAVPALWVLWLSLTVVGQEFMAFQWESLLLETGFLAIFLAPLAWRLERGEPPSRVVIFFFRWLLFRFMFLSGMVKILSGDAAWRDFTALSYHFETQPLPTPLAWYAAKLPSWFLMVQTGIMYVIELGLPFLVFGHRWMRLTAFIGFVALQIGIALTGNYGYFNLLTAVLSLLLLDDTILHRKSKPASRPFRTWLHSIALARSVVFAPIAALIVIVSWISLSSGLGVKKNWSRPMLALYAFTEPFRSINSYGLFAVMTKTRPEIIVQGSTDGQEWRDYEFKYKPGDLKRGPRIVAPHQPRLDWQMWFAALGSYQQNQWFIRFGLRLLEGSPSVLDLLASNPFPSGPPRYIRAVVYDYEFTDFKERRATGRYWRRMNERIYLPAISRRHTESATPVQ